MEKESEKTQDSSSDEIQELKENVGLLLKWKSEMEPWSQSIATKIIEIEEYTKEHNSRLDFMTNKIEYIYNDAQYKKYREIILLGFAVIIVLGFFYSVFIL